MSQPSIQIEERWPIVWVRYHAVPTDEEVEHVLSAYERYMRTRADYGIAIVTNLRHRAAQARRMGQWMKENHTHYEGRLKAMAFVSTSALLRFGLSTVFLIQPLTVPYAVVSTEAEAAEFLLSHTSSRAAS